MGNCMQMIFKAIRKKRTEKNIVLMIVGLDNAGKSLILNRIRGDYRQNVVPTVGFRTVSFKYKSASVKVYDLGGGPQIRAIWKKYYADIYGLIYVVDASDTSRLSESKLVFNDVIAHEYVAGKPILLLANKQDLNGAIDELDLVEHLGVEQVVNNMRCPTRVETCSCIYEEDSPESKENGIIEGYKWLMETILKNYSNLNNCIKMAESNEKSKRRKSSMSSKLSVWSNSYQPQENVQSEQASSETDENTSKVLGAKIKPPRKFFLPRNKTAPMTTRAEIEVGNETLPDTSNSVSTIRAQSQQRFLEKPARNDIELRLSARSREHVERPKTAPQIIQNNFFN